MTISRRILVQASLIALPVPYAPVAVPEHIPIKLLDLMDKNERQNKEREQISDSIRSKSALTRDGTNLTKTLLAESIFSFLKSYYSLPANERTHFKPAYRLKPTRGSLEGVTMALDHKGQRVPLRLAANGTVLNLPPPAAMMDRANLILSTPKGTRLSIIFYVLSSIKPEKVMNASDLAESIAQATRGTKKTAGLARAMIPKFETIAFNGARLGQVEQSGGDYLRLPLNATGAPYFTATDWPKALRVVLDRSPLMLEIDQWEKEI